ncbi:serine--tRNA ligase [bacterium]
MLSIKFIRENTDTVIKKLGTRQINAKALITAVLEKDKERRYKIQELEEMQKKMNYASGEVAELKKSGNKQAMQKSIESLKILSKNIKEEQGKRSLIEQDFRALMLDLPNIPQDNVPAGKDETENKVIKEQGEKKEFSFEPKDHVEIGEQLGIIDLKRAAKIAGARFPLLIGFGAKLERALINFMLDTHSKKGYKEIVPPFMSNTNSFIGTGQLPKFEAELFKCRDDEYYLIPTAEVPVTNIHRDEIIEEKDLTLKYMAYTPCFRREAGSYGKDTRGLIRNHQFNKVELVKITKPEHSEKELESLLKDAVNILELLKLPYRIITLCTGDLGFASSKTYDIEVWMPGEKRYREVSSCSNFTDFQARRLNMKYRTSAGKLEYVHTINGSGLACGRIFAAILENYQTIDGTVSLKGSNLKL